MKNYATYHDCQIVSTAEASAVVEYQGRTLSSVRVPAGASLGAVGVTAWDKLSDGWAFAPYIDQTLTRRPELDDTGRIGWANARRPSGWTAPRSIIPGASGRFFEDETECVTLAVPQEFFELCRGFKVSVEAALRSFIADSCNIENSASDPRADSYNRTGERGKNAAEDYLNTVFSSRVNLRSIFFYCETDDEEDDEECLLIQIER